MKGAEDEKERKMDHSEYQPWAERLKTKMDNAEYRLERLRRERGRLVGSKSPREDLPWRSRRRDRLMERAQQATAETAKSTFAIDILREFEEMNVAPTDEEAADQMLQPWLGLASVFCSLVPFHPEDAYQYWPAITNVAEKLMEVGYLTGEQVEEIVFGSEAVSG